VAGGSLLVKSRHGLLLHSRAMPWPSFQPRSPLCPIFRRSSHDTRLLFSIVHGYARYLFISPRAMAACVTSHTFTRFPCLGPALEGLLRFPRDPKPLSLDVLDTHTLRATHTPLCMLVPPRPTLRMDVRYMYLFSSFTGVLC
jgi:hypothetical protein